MRATTAAVALSLGGHALLAWMTPAAAPRPGVVWSAWDREVELTILVEPANGELLRPAGIPTTPSAPTGLITPREARAAVRGLVRARPGASLEPAGPERASEPGGLGPGNEPASLQPHTIHPHAIQPQTIQPPTNQARTLEPERQLVHGELTAPVDRSEAHGATPSDQPGRAGRSGGLVAPQNTMPQNTIPQNSMPENTMPENSMPRHIMPWDVVPSAAARGEVLAGTPGLPSRADVERALEETMDAALREAARATHLSTRPSPTLRPTRDGGYEWTGTGFVAHIAPDGAVRFSDLPGLRYEGLGPDPEAPDSFRDFAPARDALLPGATVSVRFGFDLTDALERRRGNDPYYADRAWFLRETEEVRDRLARAAATERDRVQLLRLRGRWVALIEDRARPASARRRALFSAWDELAEDEVGQRARDVLLDLVRERWPLGSAEAFTEEELGRLNAGRVRRERFAPYASVEPTRDVDEAADGR